ncbi:MAG: hypothetical protein ACI9J3_000884 [Parvicellaceae bacterium]|jgi:hypothetical protein
MKTKLFFTITLIFVGWNAKAQCNPAIPSIALVVSSTDTVSPGNLPIWVCGGGSLTLDGGFHNVYLETGATMMTQGGIDTIYVKNGATLNMAGGIHVVYYENLLDLNITAGAATNIPCTSINFDYSNGPSSGCIITSLPSETETNISVYPNPSSGIFKINSSIQKGTFEIYNLQGKKVYSGSVKSNFQIDISDQSNGIYFLKLLTIEGVVNKKIILNRLSAK